MHIRHVTDNIDLTGSVVTFSLTMKTSPHLSTMSARRCVILSLCINGQRTSACKPCSSILESMNVTLQRIPASTCRTSLMYGWSTACVAVLFAGQISWGNSYLKWSFFKYQKNQLKSKLAGKPFLSIITSSAKFIK